MNERIRQLADEADKWSQTMSWSSDPKYGDRSVSDLFNEKFAELIVRECSEFARQHNLAKAERSYMIHEAIKQHFGVED